MKKFLIFLVILSFVCIVAVSCGADAAVPSTTTTDVTSASVLTTVATNTIEPEAVDTTKASTTVETPASSTTTTTEAPETTQKPASTTRDPNEGWGIMIPIT